MNSSESAALIVSEYENVISQGARTLPYFDEKVLDGLTLAASSVFRNEPGLLDAVGDFIVVGDIHGHIFDLLRIFRQFGLPPSTKYAFLGDMVDRGPFSTETVTLIFALKVCYPKDVYVIRGNHEFQSLCSVCGFRDEVLSLNYSRALFDSFLSVFNVIPLALRINGDVLCLHGGIGPNIRDLSDIERVPRSVCQLYGGVADSIVWSDPCEDVMRFEQSVRGNGYQFGRQALRVFLENNGLRLLVRGHQSIEEGVRYGLDGMVVTVFSASNYCNSMGNNSGVVKLYESEKEELVVLNKIAFVERKAVKLVSPDGEEIQIARPSSPSVKSSQTFAFSKHAKVNGMKLVQAPRCSACIQRRTSMRPLKIK